MEPRQVWLVFLLHQYIHTTVRYKIVERVIYGTNFELVWFDSDRKVFCGTENSQKVKYSIGISKSIKADP